MCTFICIFYDFCTDFFLHFHVNFTFLHFIDCYFEKKMYLLLNCCRFMLTFNKEQYTRFLQINAIFYYSLNTQKLQKI